MPDDDAPTIGCIVLAATPLGNVQDASPRLVHLLQTAGIIAAEDTRRLRRLASSLGIEMSGRVLSYHDANERERAIELVDAAASGATVLVVTDAGMPSVSDPGYRVVAEAVAREVPVTAAPGPSAVLMALAVSGLPVDRFCFEGFLPRKGGERQARIADLAGEVRTMVFFEAPHRLEAMLSALAHGLGGARQAAVCRELTKTYEQVIRGSLDELVAWAGTGVRGECTVVVSGASADELRAARGLESPDDWVEAVQAREVAGLDRKAAIAEVARAVGVGRREVYDAVVRAKPARP
ncbi:MAG: 16S rRNA (cytidine(1402)-2'-O)-methyltransferase [Candidatus Nanopelagicales bacterium]|nr:16S rRNA (cytidine(1402)-2'-O)-methyltransferase [Candidatus Nanopelagicales bacterium]